MHSWCFSCEKTVNSSLVYAGRLRRLSATIVDAILVPTLTVFFILVAGVVEDAEDYENNVWMLWVLLLAIASYLVLNGYLLWRSGQTIGKKLLGIAIVAVNDSTGTCEKAVFWKLICIRALFFPLIFTIITPLAFLPLIDQILIFSRKRRCLHDLAAGTTVVRLLKAKE